MKTNYYYNVQIMNIRTCKENTNNIAKLIQMFNTLMFALLKLYSK